MSDDLPFVAPHLLDASAAIKLLVKEQGSDALRNYFETKLGGYFISSLCFVEVFSALKAKWLRKEINDNNYFGASYLFTAHVRNRRIKIVDSQVLSTDAFFHAVDLAKKYDLDLADSLQLISLKGDQFKLLVQESKAILVTADKGLEKAALAEGFRVWNCVAGTSAPAQ